MIFEAPDKCMHVEKRSELFLLSNYANYNISMWCVFIGLTQTLPYFQQTAPSDIWLPLTTNSK